MTIDTVQKRILELLERETGSQYTLDQDLMEEGCLSSLELMGLIASVEAEFRVKIPSRDLRFVATAEDLAELVCKKAGLP